MKISRISGMLLVSLAVAPVPASVSARTMSGKNENTVCQDTGQQKKEEESEEKSNAKSGVSFEKVFEKMLGMKIETSLEEPFVENLGHFFLDKRTGEVTMLSHYKNEPVRWHLTRDEAPDDIVNDNNAINYQLVRYGTGSNDIVLVNINTGAMWMFDLKGITFSYRRAKLTYVPMTDTCP